MNSPVLTVDRLLEAAPDDPAPLAVSTASKTKLGIVRLRFTKAAGVPDVECTQITVTIPVGETGTDLTGNPGNIDYKYASSSGNWSITASSDRSRYVCTPSGPGKKFVFTDTAYFTVILDAIPVGRLPGEAALTLTAATTTAATMTAATTTAATTTAAPGEEDWTVPITKAVDDFFFFRAFSCEQPQIPNPGTAILRWEGSEHETEYWLSYDGRDPQQVTGQSAQITGITDTTTFVLDARTPDPQTGKFDRHHYLSTTVTVKEPTILAKELTAKKINVPDTLTADGSSKTTTLHGPATFEEDVTVMAKLIVNGTITNKDGTVRIDAAVSATGLNANSGEIRTTGNLRSGAATVTSLDAQSGVIKTSGALNTGDATVASLDAKSGAIKTSGALNTGAATVASLDAKSGAIKTSGALNTGDATVASLNAKSGAIKTTGTVSDGGSAFLRFGTTVVIRNRYHNTEGLNEDNKPDAKVSLKAITTNNARWWWYLDQPK
ncbi:hypothetical protein ACFQ6N_04725 [Kitasatospora sp. NPDC056446]|uniref:hypothetical protein n=1 Tax=Kitasatospora sp. NPDC056446 TaxID=3345819 RepID=UPI0036CD0B15